MKSFIILTVTSLVATNVFAQQFHLVRTCSNPMLVEGELKVYLSQDRKEASVSLSGIKKYPTKIVSVGGPIMTFDYNTGFSVERIIIAADGGHELHSLDKNTNKFKKIGNLTCY
jgi:hypothetical protein